MFDHSTDKIILIRNNIDGTKGKDGEDSEAIDAALCSVDIYYRYGKQAKAVGQCTDSGGEGVTEGEAEGLSAVRRQDDVLYYVATCVLHAAPKSLQNTMEKNFCESGLGEETFQKKFHTYWSAQEDIGK